MSTTSPSLDFEIFNDFISLYIPPQPVDPEKSQNDPTCIVVCQWMGAKKSSRALQTVYSQYAKVYPFSRIIRIRSDLHWFTTTSTSTRQAQLMPAVHLVHADQNHEKKRVLVHVFSNGGGVALYEICALYKNMFNKPLPIRALVLDSVPGSPTIPEAWSAMKTKLPKDKSRYAVSASMWMMIASLWIWTRVLRQEMLIDRMRKGLVNFEVMDRQSKRLYIFSDNDKIVNSKCVLKHIVKLSQLGIRAQILRDNICGHVEFMVQYPDQYWNRIWDLWNEE